VSLQKRKKRDKTAEKLFSKPHQQHLCEPPFVRSWRSKMAKKQQREHKIALNQRRKK
jgi:hypothetical protein